ncbi:MAG TPA: Gfo/Idh/MocA family oxidoreductase [Mycobacterium sp.]|nr:Gfo/Idh/MocA family oxidoreductase [Mycobacterium sp.]
MSAPFRFGLIGGGRMGRTHLRALDGSTEVRVVAVTEPVETAAALLREQGLAVYPTVEEMFAESELDGVLIAVPTPQHIDTTRKALEAGLPVLCEKPFGLVPDDARAAGELASEKGLALQIAYWRRFVPQLSTLRSDLADGKYGTVHFLVCSQWDEAPPPLSFRNDSGGIYIDMGVHEVDQTRWLLGQDFTDVKAQVFPTTEDPGAQNDVDSAQALVMLSGGTSTVISLGRFYEGGDIVSIELYGSRGHTRFNVVSPETGEGPQLHALKLQAEAFARHARGAAPEGATAEEAARVLELAHGLTEAAGIAVVVGAP